MDEVVNGTLEIWYREPVEFESFPVPLVPGGFYEIIPPAGYVVDKIRVNGPGVRRADVG